MKGPESPESIWLPLALGAKRSLDFFDEAGLLEREVSALLPGSPAEEAAERFAAESDISIGLELVRLLDLERSRCDGELREKLGSLAEFAQLLCACLGDARSAADVAVDLLGLANGKDDDEDDSAKRTLTTAAVGWLAAAAGINWIVGAANPPFDAVCLGLDLLREYESEAIMRMQSRGAKPDSGAAGPAALDLRGMSTDESVAAINKLADEEAARFPDAPEQMVVVAGVAASSQRDVGSDFDAINGSLIELVATPDLAPIRARLLTEFPYAVEAVDALLSDLVGKRSIRFRPTLIVGSPGSGKSRLARRLAEELDLPAVTYPCAGVGDSSLAGTARRWSSTEPSLPLRLIRDRECANPVIVLDELDKAAAGNMGNGGRLWDCLVQLLETETAREWVDPYIQAPCDLSAVVWLATANDLRPIPDVLLDRFRVLRMPSPRREDLPALAAAMLADAALDRGLGERWVEPLAPYEIEGLQKAWRGGSLRALRRLCEGVMAARDQAMPRA